MSRYKILALPGWCKNALEYDKDLLKRYEQITPVFFREGWYFDRLNKTSWYEFFYKLSVIAIKDMTTESFVYDIAILNHRPLSKTERKAIKDILLYRDNKELKNLLYFDDLWISIRDANRNGMLAGMATS